VRVVCKQRANYCGFFRRTTWWFNHAMKGDSNRPTNFLCKLCSPFGAIVILKGEVPYATMNLEKITSS
jgi:hypothetical protein